MGDKRDGTKCLSQHRIVVSNLLKEETLTFSLALLKGEIILPNNDVSNRDFCNNYLTLYNLTKKTATNWPILKSKFKCLVDLERGENRIILKYCTTCKRIVLNYTPRDTDHFVTPLYIICRNHSGQFQAPSECDNSIDSACDRVVLGSKLIQCLIAEKLFENGFGRKTFQIEADVIDKIPYCIQFYSSLPVEEARQMDQEALWIYFGREIMKSNFSSTKRKFLAFLSATWWDGSDSDGVVKAHAALGGGGLALFGTGCLHTWPTRVEDVFTCFLDPTPVDTSRIMDDSCFRGTYGGCFSTTLGSVCHELGHTFDLGHSKEGIMGRGFDNIDMVFLPHSHCYKDSYQCIQFATVQLISRLKVECFVTSSSDSRSRFNSPMRQPNTTNTNSNTTSNNSNTTSNMNNSNNSNSALNDSPRRSMNSPSKLMNSPSKFSTNRNKRNTNVLVVQQQIKNKDSDLVNGVDDRTYWTPSCATLLAYHKWFNCSQSTRDELKYNSVRGLVTSSAGLRVVELRGDESLVLHSWQFTGPRAKNQLVVPKQMSSRAQLIVVEDNNGNIIKQDLTTTTANNNNNSNNNTVVQ